MNRLVFTASFLMVTSSAFGQSPAESSGVNSAMGIPPKTEDFITEVSASDLYEIESSKLALQRGDDATKTFAQQMITDHEKTSSELNSLIEAGKAKGAPANALTKDHKSEIDGLAKLQGPDFVKEYVDEQVEAHEDAVDLFKRYAAEGENADLKAWAAKTLPALEHHYKMAQDLDKD